VTLQLSALLCLDDQYSACTTAVTNIQLPVILQSNTPSLYLSLAETITVRYQKLRIQCNNARLSIFIFAQHIFRVYTTYVLKQIRITAALNKPFSGEVGGRLPPTRY
jgi:hypothetical protein